MERTVPTTASEAIDLYLRTFYSLLRTTAEVQIRTMEESHSAMNSLLHPDARKRAPDMSAFIYCLLRLPDCIFEVDMVVMGQGEEDFSQAGYGQVETWQRVNAPARRRRCFFNGQDTLACYIASRTDIDDLIPLLTAFQIEWNKMNLLLARAPVDTAPLLDNPDGRLAALLEMELEDLDRLKSVWGKDFAARMAAIGSRNTRIRVQLLSGSLNAYRRATLHWMENIERKHGELFSSPVYFVSSNTHSLANMVSGFTRRHRDGLFSFLEEKAGQALKQEWEQIRSGQLPSSEENFLYYALRKYQELDDCRLTLEMQYAHESQAGIARIPSLHSFDVEAQVIHLSQIQPDLLDPRIRPGEAVESALPSSNAIILNIDYPLGLAAYNILAKVAEHAGVILGAYVLGKAATLNGVIGDVMIPNVVHDEHSRNTYLFTNCFRAQDVTPDLIYGSALDHQKAVTVLGTFLQNHEFMDVFYSEGYTDIEMEAGPYLSAIYEIARPKRHPVYEIVNLTDLPFDLGFIHYASDTPLSKGKNLGAGSLSYFGLDSTYAASAAILRRIFTLEHHRLQSAN